MDGTRQLLSADKGRLAVAVYRLRSGALVSGSLSLRISFERFNSVLPFAVELGRPKAATGNDFIRDFSTRVESISVQSLFIFSLHSRTRSLS